jgi:hypothetical protein
MHAKILSMVAVCGLLIGSTALAQAQPSGVSGPRAQGGESHRSAVAHQTQKRGDVRDQRGASKSARGRITGVGAGNDKTTGFGGRDSDGFRQDLDEPATGDREGHLRGDRASGMMDNVRRDDDGPSE